MRSLLDLVVQMAKIKINQNLKIYSYIVSELITKWLIMSIMFFFKSVTIGISREDMTVTNENNIFSINTY